MTVILDTHTLIWLDTDASKLSPLAVQVLEDPANTLLLSHASVWEMAIKVAAGRLTLTQDLELVLAEQTTLNPISYLPIALDHCLAVRSLPRLHGDPFDRMLVAQAQIENASLLSCDQKVRQYPIRVIW